VPVKIIDAYQIEYTAEALGASKHWGAFVEITVQSENPMHMDSIFAKCRVAADITFASEVVALAEAEEHAMKILGQLRG
jgi:hypothetical protein